MTALLLAVQKSHPCADKIIKSLKAVYAMYEGGLYYTYYPSGKFWVYHSVTGYFSHEGKYTYSDAGVKILNQ